MTVTSLYAALLAVLFVILSMRTIRLRRRLQVAIGHANDRSLERAMRAHANFSEYVPIALLLVFLLESALANRFLIHLLGITLLAGRLLHAFGVSRIDEDYRFRVTGMVMTFTVILVAAAAILAKHTGILSG
jgi:uncharacterized membrane protein YecN with MAPEG domain